MSNFSKGAGPMSKEELKSEIEHATGLEKAELEAQLKGEELFGPTVLTGSFGTAESPVIVPSVFADRIVGCSGSEEHSHDLKWHTVHESKDLVCLECGQFFRLNRQVQQHNH
jgi:cytochrome c oxidase subunit 5b